MTTAETEQALSPAIKNPEWHAVVDDLVVGGRTPEDARCVLTRLLVLQTLQFLLDGGRSHLAVGHDIDAALLAIAASAVRDLPSRIEAAAGDQAAAREAVISARKRLKSSGALLDMVHPSGRQPLFTNIDEILGDIEEFLTTADPNPEEQP